MTEERKGTGDILSTLTIAVLFLVILLLVVFSASSYKHATDVQNENNNRRALLSYVVSCVRESSGNKVEPKSFDGAPGISIGVKGGKFERRIYMKDGKLLEEYAETGSSIIPEDALVIGETDTFEVNVIDGAGAGSDKTGTSKSSLLEIKTDAGSSYVRTGDK